MSYKAGKLIIFLSFSVAILGVSILKDRKGEYLGEVKKEKKLNQTLTLFNDNYVFCVNRENFQCIQHCKISE